MVDVAREAGVSLKTVSRVVNNEPTVQSEYVLRVRKAIEELGFVRNNIARDLRSNSMTSIIGLVIGDLGNPFYSMLARSIERVARRHGSLLVICSSEEDPDRERELILELCERRVDGLIVVPTYVEHSFCKEEIDRGMPMVFLDRQPQGIEADCVVIENEGGAYRGAKLLFERGHRRIGVVGQDMRIGSMEERLSGVRRAAREADVVLDDELIRFGPLTPEQATAAAGELLELENPPTAFFCCTNRLTLGVMKKLAERHLEIDVVGFDNIEPTCIGLRPFAVLAYDLEQLGKDAAELLFQRIKGRKVTQHIVVPTKLVLS